MRPSLVSSLLLTAILALSLPSPTSALDLSALRTSLRDGFTRLTDPFHSLFASRFRRPTPINEAGLYASSYAKLINSFGPIRNRHRFWARLAAKPLDFQVERHLDALAHATSDLEALATLLDKARRVAWPPVSTSRKEVKRMRKEYTPHFENFIRRFNGVVRGYASVVDSLDHEIQALLELDRLLPKIERNAERFRTGYDAGVVLELKVRFLQRSELVDGHYRVVRDAVQHGEAALRGVLTEDRKKIADAFLRGRERTAPSSLHNGLRLENVDGLQAKLEKVKESFEELESVVRTKWTEKEERKAAAAEGTVEGSVRESEVESLEDWPPVKSSGNRAA